MAPKNSRGNRSGQPHRDAGGAAAGGQDGGIFAEEDPLAGGRLNIMSKEVTLEIRLAFVRKVYALLAVQMLLTTLIALPIGLAGKQWAHQHSWLMFVGFGLYLSVSIAMLCFRRFFRRIPWNYCLLLALTLGSAIMVGFTTTMYTPQSVVLAAGLASAVFLSLSAYAWFTTTDFTGYRPYLFAFAMVLLIFGLAICIMRFCGLQVHWLVIIHDILGVLLFSCYTVVHTQLILGEYGGHKSQFSVDDYCLAAIHLYMDLIHLFRLLLRLLGKKK